MDEKLQLLHRGLLVEYASLAWMIIESLVAVGAGVSSGSLALLAFGGDIILASSYTVADYLRRVTKAENGESERAEGVTKITTALLFILIPVIGLGALYTYLSGLQAEASPLAIAVSLGAVVLMPVLWYEKKRIGKAADCLPLTIDAVESETCFLMSITLLASLLVNYFLKIWWVDYVATIVILAFVAKEALESLSEAKEP